MKKSARVLMALLVCIVSLFSCAFASEAEEAGADEGADPASIDQSMQDGADDETKQAPNALNEPAVRWSYSMPITVLQSPCLVLVNNDNLLDKSFEPTPMVKMNMVKRATSATIYLHEMAAKAVQEMFEAALQVTQYDYVTLNSKGEEVTQTAEFKNGMVLFLKSGYRSYGTQATTYANYMARNNNVDDGYVARPGASEHQSGLCADILNADFAEKDRMTQDFNHSPEAQWMKSHCADFGLILRFPEDKENETGIKFEPWHFRYVGKEIAGYIMSTGISFEEFTSDWEAEMEAFKARGGDIAVQLAYEDSRLNVPPSSYILDELGTDGDAEISLVF